MTNTMLVQSIRFRMFLLYILILFATLIFFSALTHAYFEQTLRHKMDSMLELKAKGVETSIRTYLKTERFKTSGWENFFQMFRQKEDRFTIIAEFLTGREITPTAGDFGMVVEIFDTSSKLIASTNRGVSQAYIPPAAVKAGAAGTSRYYDFKDPARKRRPSAGRALVRPVMDGRELQYLIQVRASLVPVREELSGLRNILLVLILVTLFIASWASMVFVHVTLHPVEKMVRIIRGIKSENLNVRLSVPDTGDEIARLAETFNDVLARLEKSFTAQRQIVQDISHELKTPLTVLRGEMEVALKKSRSQKEYEEVIRASLIEIENIRNIITNLLTLARLDSDKVGLEMKSVDLSQLARGVFEDIRLLADSKNVKVSYEEGGPVRLKGDTLHLKRLLTNLLENAVKYTPSGGRISLELSQREKQATVDVKDTGVGISDEDLPHIFDRFYRARKGQGSSESFGLGLSIVKSIVDVHKGHVEVKSAVGEGTHFHVRLPIGF